MSVDILEQSQLAHVAARQQVRILIIDDDAAQAGLLARHLGRQGFATVWADSGKTGLMLARLRQPKLVVLDLRLPDADGLAVCEQLGDDPATCGIPVIILGAARHRNVVRRCRAAGCHFFLCTPYDPNVVLVLIRRALADTSF